MNGQCEYTVPMCTFGFTIYRWVCFPSAQLSWAVRVQCCTCTDSIIEFFRHRKLESTDIITHSKPFRMDWFEEFWFGFGALFADFEFRCAWCDSVYRWKAASYWLISSIRTQTKLWSSFCSRLSFIFIHSLSNEFKSLQEIDVYTFIHAFGVMYTKEIVFGESIGSMDRVDNLITTYFVDRDVCHDDSWDFNCCEHRLQKALIINLILYLVAGNADWWANCV